MMMYMIVVILLMLLVVQGIAFVTLFERHLLGASQQRVGPNKVSLSGLLQAIFDGLKLMKKEQLMIKFVSERAFFLIPGLAFLVMFFMWFLLPYYYIFTQFSFSFLMFMCLLGFSVYSILLIGLVSKSKYSYIGALRASGQSVSYEIVFSIYILMLILLLNLFHFLYYSNFLFLIFFLPVLLSVLAELNRAPFDFAEGESELVSGFNVEYSSVTFILIFLSEYGMLMFFSVLMSFMFFNGSLFFSYILMSIMIFIRSSFPRFRYDMMMYFFWFCLLPISLIFMGGLIFLML